MKSVDKAWLAGIIDGEGYLQIVKRKDSRLTCGYVFWVALTISMCHKPTIERISNMTGMPMSIQRRKEENKRDIWLTYTSSNKATAILKQIYPYLVTKREECEILFRYQQKFSGQGKGRGQDTFGEKNKLYSKLRKLKKVEYST